MIVDRAWVIRNIGFDPIGVEARPFRRTHLDDLQRDIIEFDSESPEGAAFLAVTKSTGLSRFTEIPWPGGLAPKTGPKPASGPDAPLPRADALIVTWTVDEGHALSRVLTPGKDSRNDYVPYAHNFASLSRNMSRGSPAMKAQRLGAYWPATIGAKTVLVFKSDSHLSQDTNHRLPPDGALPNALLWRQIIEEVRPSLILTTGTAGGIGKDFEVGDVIVSPTVRFDSRKWLRKAPFRSGVYKSKPAVTNLFAEAAALFKANSGELPKDNSRPPKIVTVDPAALASSIVTTDFFGFDTSDNHFKLWNLGDASEMGDAVLGLIADELGGAAPPWVAVRNVSDPEIKADGLTIEQQGDMAAAIYKAYGRWSSVCSAIVCWALIAAL